MESLWCGHCLEQTKIKPSRVMRATCEDAWALMADETITTERERVWPPQEQHKAFPTNTLQLAFPDVPY
jgi:hypothetical protein